MSDSEVDMTRRRANSPERFDVICDCGWKLLRCPESEIPRNCPECGGAIIEEFEGNPEDREPFISKLSTRADQESQPEVGKRIETTVDVTFASGSVVRAGAKGVIVRVEPAISNILYLVKMDDIRPSRHDNGERAFSRKQFRFVSKNPELPRCEGCGRPTANRSGLCSACASMGHRNNPRHGLGCSCRDCSDRFVSPQKLAKLMGKSPEVSRKMIERRSGQVWDLKKSRWEDIKSNPYKTCPRCGTGVKDVATECWKCGLVFDTRAGGSVLGRVARGSFGAARNPGAKLLVRYVYDKEAGADVDELDPDDPAWEAAIEAFADDMGGTFDIRAEVEAVLKKVKAFTGPPQVGGDPETALELCYAIRGLTEAKRLAALLRKEFAGRRNIQFAAVERCEDSPFQVQFHER